MRHEQVPVTLPPECQLPFFVSLSQIVEVLDRNCWGQMMGYDVAELYFLFHTVWLLLTLSPPFKAQSGRVLLAC